MKDISSPFIGVHDTFTYQLLVFSYWPKLTFVWWGLQFSVWLGDESGQSMVRMEKLSIVSFMQWMNLYLRPLFSFSFSLKSEFASIALFCRDWELFLKLFSAFLAEAVLCDDNESKEAVST